MEALEGTASNPILLDDAPTEISTPLAPSGPRIKHCPQPYGLGTVHSPLRLHDQVDVQDSPSDFLFQNLLGKIAMELETPVSVQHQDVAWRLVYCDGWYPRTPDELTRFCKTLEVKLKAWQHGQQVYKMNMIARIKAAENAS